MVETSTEGMVFTSPYRTTGLVGAFTYFNGPAEIIELNEGSQVYVGKYCSIAKGLKLILGNYHRADWVSTFPFHQVHPDSFPSVSGATGHPKTNGDIVIGNDVWIGDSATIMSGVTVGDGAVIAANSHVVRNVEPYSIVGGNPAKQIKFRFSPRQIEDLLELRWWDMSIAEVDSLTPLLMSDDVDSLIRKARALRYGDSSG
jgi:acetyltransferase-like isoleucine patch superfamily enzyme